jgi:hypothetical protein
VVSHHPSDAVEVVDRALIRICLEQLGPRLLPHISSRRAVVCGYNPAFSSTLHLHHAASNSGPGGLAGCPPESVQQWMDCAAGMEAAGPLTTRSSWSELNRKMAVLAKRQAALQLAIR